MVYLAFGPYGNIRFGDEKPEFSKFSWIGMIFTAGIGSSILYWAPQEWAYYFKAPPNGAEALSAEAAEVAVGLAIIVMIYRNTNSIDINVLNRLKW